MTPKTLIIDNFRGSMTINQDGDINSGLANVIVSGGYNPFLKPGNLTWARASEQIDEAGAVITDLILAGKERVESGILYVYCIGHTGRLYKIQVNNPATYNPDYDNPVLLATLTAETPTFTRGGFIDFFGSTERIYIGHDKGVTRIEFDGTSETFVGSTSSWVQTVPRPFRQFIGKLYIGNGNNIAEIDSTALVTTYTKLTPAFPTGTQVRDIDISPEGTYVQMVVTRLALGNITTGTQDTSTTANSESYLFKWNGIDLGYTAYSTFPNFSLVANTMFQDYNYTFGYDQNGGAVFNPSQKVLSLQEVVMPNPNAVGSNGNLVDFLSPLYFDGVMEIDYLVFGQVDFEVGLGYWDIFYQNATGTETDVVSVPFKLPISNFGVGSSSNGYAGNVYSNSKVYFSTLETSSAPTTKYKLYKWFPVANTIMDSSPTLTGAPYQTQTQIFSNKIKPVRVRIYGEPWVANNSFTIDLIGSAGTPITGASKTFTAGTNLTVGNDYAWYDPQCAPTYAIALRVTNEGVANNTITKIEIDYTDAGI